MKLIRDPQNDADVQHLLKLFPDILPDGRLITHSQLEAALTLPRISARYRTVVSKWRRVLTRERCVYLDGLLGHGNGFISLTVDEMVRFGDRGVRAAGRKLKRAIHVVSLPDDAALSEDVRKYRGRLSMALEMIATQHRASLRDMSRGLAPQAQLPKRKTGTD